ncbi:MAG: TonB-dependent receptor plug domain-containing protein [Bacteroidales bacterium]|nr:TonB-dependent receptor plug domain-containing protein [Bacteroidales bacterium]
MMKFFVLLFCFVFCGFNLHAQDTVQVRQLDSIRIVAQRRLRDMGVQKTSLDSAGLRNDITGSLAQVLSQNSTVFIKSYGRATLSTASFRGTSPSHTQVTWNGMKLNSPMLGMVDFSIIPSYFIDEAHLYHGPGSVIVASGGLGGAIALSTRTIPEEGLHLHFIQGIGSFRTFDDFLRVSFGKNRWKTSTRIYYTSSANDYIYTNYRKKIFYYDQQGNITGFEYPREQNQNGSFLDFHVLQDIDFNGSGWGNWNLSAWYSRTDRGIPLLNVDYKENTSVRNNQRENAFRGVIRWRKLQQYSKWEAKAGYTYTDLLYEYKRDMGDNQWANMVHAQSYVNTFFSRLETEWYINKWMFSGNLTVNQHFVTSLDNAVVSVEGKQNIMGYEQARVEASGFLSVKYRPAERLGFSVDVRKDLYGSDFTPLIPSFFAEYLVSRRGEVVLKASAARNFRYPTLNDLYFMPGGNPELKPEQGVTFDGGIATAHKGSRYSWNGSVTGFYSLIDNWIVWLPTFKGFWSPVNVKQVKSYGMEVNASLAITLNKNWKVAADGHFAWTRSLNMGDPVNWADQAIGKQLVYIPEFSSAITGRISWKEWTFMYQWTYYSQRYTTSSNQTNSRIGVLSPYFMNDISLETAIRLPHLVINLKGIVRNLFNEEYESVLARPMPGINYTLSIGISPL